MKVRSPSAPGRTEIPETPEEAADYIEKYFGPRDRSIKDLVDAAQGRLCPKDNLVYERRSMSLYHDTKTKVILERVKNPFMVILEWADRDDYCKLKWMPVDQDKINVAIKFDTDPEALTLVNIGVWGD